MNFEHTFSNLEIYVISDLERRNSEIVGTLNKNHVRSELVAPYILIVG